MLQRVIILYRADRGSEIVVLRSGANAGSSGALHKRSEASPKLFRSFPKLQESQGQSLVTGRVQFVLLESWRLTKLRTDRKLETFRRLANAEA